jgi:osmotically-inducible protein OsmY
MDPSVQQELERRIAARTRRQVRDLRVEVQGGRVVLRGRASCYYLKQLAQQGAREVLPDVPLENVITVG